MTRLSRVTFVCVGALPVGLLPAAGCSSSNGAAPPTEAGAEASAEAAAVLPDGGEGGASGLSLTWRAVTYVPSRFSTPLPGDGGPAAAPDGGADTDASATADAEAQDAAGDAGDGGRAPGVPGVQVCAFPQAGPIPAPGAASGNCVTTDANGEFVLRGLPVRTNIALTINKAGFTPGLLSVATASMDMDSRNNPVTMFPTSFQTDPPPPVAVDWQKKGQIYSFVLALNGAHFEGQPGATVSMSPMSGNGAIYLDQNEGYVQSAQAYIDNGADLFNVDPGLYTLTFVDPTNPNIDCEPILGFAGFGYPVTKPAHSIQVLVAAGYISGLAGVLCTTKPPIVSVDGG